MRQRILYSLRIVFPLAGVLFLTAAAPGEDKSEPFADSVLLPRGMVADPLGSIGFVPNAGAIDAVDLQTGNVLWTTKEASSLAAAGRVTISAC
jgi:hypothetical protein